MAVKRTFLDANVLVRAYRGTGVVQERALEIVGDPNREFVINQYLVLELLPKPTHNKQLRECEFYRDFIDSAVEVVESAKSLSDDAIVLAMQHGLGPIDALHATCALKARVSDFITVEGATKPFMRVSGLHARSIGEPRKQKFLKRARKALKQRLRAVEVWCQRTLATWRG